jgi:hypothetical protein
MNHQPDADSKENRLTCHPVGRPLSAVGFTNAKTQLGASALLRDNDLLSRPRTSNHKKNQKQSPASPVCPASPDLQVGLPDNHLQNLPLSLAALAPPLAGRLQKPISQRSCEPPAQTKVCGYKIYPLSPASGGSTSLGFASGQVAPFDLTQGLRHHSVFDSALRPALRS